MSHDGCEEVTWKGKAFPYLMHHDGFHRTENYGSARAAGGAGHGATASHGHGGAHTGGGGGGGGSDTTQRSGTGTWLGPAPRGAGPAAAQAAAAAPPRPVREPADAILSNGSRMPMIGMGTYKVDSPDPIKKALELGYRHFDCASYYGNQAVIGEGLKDIIAEGRRGELFITSKVWNDEHRPEAARASVTKTLKDLGVEYLDLLLVHWPDSWLPGSDARSGDIKPDTEWTLEQTWRVLEAFVDEGLVRGIGLSNCSTAQVEAILKIAKHKPLVNQVELHPLLAQRKMVGVLFRQGVACVAYAPLGSHTAEQATVLGHPTVLAIAERSGRTPAQVLLRYNMQRGVPVIPKASSATHMAENIAHAFDWRLSNDDKAALDALDAGRRFIDTPGGWHKWGDAEEGGVLKPSLVLKQQQAAAAAQ